ncbi:MAG: hypothetical protein DMG76_26780 [Acidobacteria bacterium]|nr:MAG: hypothetical protein DMG76_26780 [Acidobacteriota bacterium]
MRSGFFLGGRGSLQAFSLQPPGRSLIDILQLARQALVVADVVFAVQIKAGAARAVRCAWPRKCRLTPHSANLYLEGKALLGTASLNGRRVSFRASPLARNILAGVAFQRSLD